MPKDNEGADNAKQPDEKKPAPPADKKPDAPSPEAASLEGLVKMKRDGKTIHAHPSTVHDHQKNGWKEV